MPPVHNTLTAVRANHSLRPGHIVTWLLIVATAGLTTTACASQPTIITLEANGQYTAEPGTTVTFVAQVPDTAWFRLFVDDVKICDIRQIRPAYGCTYTAPSTPGTQRVEVRTNASQIVTQDSPNRSFFADLQVANTTTGIVLAPDSMHTAEAGTRVALLAQVPDTAWLRMFANGARFCDIREPRTVYACPYDVPPDATDVAIEVRSNASTVVTPDNPNRSFFSTLTTTDSATVISLTPASVHTVDAGSSVSLTATVPNTAWFRIFVDGTKICDIRQPQSSYSCAYTIPAAAGQYTVEVRTNASVVADSDNPSERFFSTLVVPPAEYTLYFADEFDDNHNGRPNPAHWDYKTGTVINNEQQCYTDDHPDYTNAGIRNVAVQTRNIEGADNGYLVLSLKKETVACRQANGATFNYTSGAVATRVDGFGTPYLVDMPHGVYEIRAKIPAGRGTWPAIWLLGKKDYTPDSPFTIGWPDAGEIDIMEAVGFEEANGVYRFHHTLHRNRDLGFLWPHRRPNRTGQGMTYDLPEPPSLRFHVFKMIWAPESIEFFVDGVRVRKIDLGDGVTGERNGLFRSAPDVNGWGHPNTPLDDHLGWPFAMEAGNRFKLILNLAWGGGWGGQQGLDDSIFDNGEPVEMLIDYVRIYTR